MSKWEKRFLGLAEFIAQWSKDPDHPVGAVLVNSVGMPIAMGFNGFPSGVQDSTRRLKDKDIKRDIIIHAEQNALLIAGLANEGAAMYVWGKPICARCAGPIIQAKLKKVIAMHPKYEKPGIWRDQGFLALKMFKEAGVNIKFAKQKRKERA